MKWFCVLALSAQVAFGQTGGAYRDPAAPAPSPPVLRKLEPNDNRVFTLPGARKVNVTRSTAPTVPAPIASAPVERVPVEPALTTAAPTVPAPAAPAPRKVFIFTPATNPRQS